MKTQTEKQKIEREIENLNKKNKELCKKYGIKNNFSYKKHYSKYTELKSKLLGFNLAKECVLEDVMEIIDEMGNFNCGFMDGELCERIDKEKLKQKIEELRK
jgi:hypothetical protein